MSSGRRDHFVRNAATLSASLSVVATSGHRWCSLVIGVINISQFLFDQLNSKMEGLVNFGDGICIAGECHGSKSISASVGGEPDTIVWNIALRHELNTSHFAVPSSKLVMSATSLTPSHTYRQTKRPMYL